MKLLFMDREDVFNTWGHVRFRPAVLERVAELEPDPAVSPDFTVRCCVRQDDGSYVVYACDGGRDHKPWQIYRYHTEDGIHPGERKNRCTGASRDAGRRRPP